MNENNSSRAQLILNTSQSSCTGFNEYLSACEEFERLSFSNKPHLSYIGSIKATMASEEIFECSKINEDIYTTVSEYQNTYNASAVTLTTNLSQSIENAMQYFEEDISISSPSSRSTPTNFNTIGKVATMVANLKRQTEIEASEAINHQPKSKIEPIKPNIKKLRAIYDDENNQEMKNSQQVTTKTKTNINSPTELKAPALIKAMKLKTAAIKPRAPLPASPKITRKTKVKQIAQMFNARISQLIQRNPAEVGNYTPLNNEYSPDPKQQLKTPTSTPPVAKPRKHIVVANLAAKSTPPLPKPRNKLPTYRTGGGVHSPQPSPRLRRRNSLRSSDNTFFIVEDAFSQLSVKDKVMLYTKFINDMNQKNQQLRKNSESLNLSMKKQLANGEVINEKQESVKHLTKELEAKCNFPKQTVSQKALLRMQSIIDTTFVDKQSHDAQTSMYNEDDNLYHAECAQVVEDIEEKNPLHISTLTVVLKASPNRETYSLPTSAERPQVLSSKQRRLLHLSLMEPSYKRSNESIRSVHLSSDPYAPPKKIRRTRSEQLNPIHFFQDSKVKKQFFEWIKERNGVDFAITLSDSEQKPVDILPTEEENSVTANISEVTQKSAVERLLEEAMVKLTNTHISTSELKDIEMMDNMVYEERQKSAPPPTPILNKPQRKPKRQAPLPPIDASETGKTTKKTNCDSGISTLKKKVQVQPISSNAANSTGSSIVSSAKQSNNERESGESGVSYLPKPPENELQKSHENNPAALSEHQLRIQASLQRLNIPDWFRQYNQTQAHSPEGGAAGTASTYKPGNFTRKRTQDSGRWAGLNSKTTSLSSLGSQRSDRSPLLLSPSAHSHHGGQTTHAGNHNVTHTTSAYSTAGTGNSGGAFSRWSTSHLNSSQTSPSVSQRGSFSRGGPINSSFMSVASGGNNSSVIRNSFRQPYLGWRSTEKLSQRTAHERLASSLLAQQQRTLPTTRSNTTAANGGVSGVNNQVQQPVTPEIQSSIKEVTSAIVHYVNDQTNQQRSRSTSPNSRKCWLESSFVGIRPLDSPQTPVIETAGTAFNVANAANSFVANNSNNTYNNPVISATAATPTTAAYFSNTIATETTAATGAITSSTIGLTTNAANVLRMNGLSLSGGAPERSLSSASLEDVLASLLGLSTTSGTGAGFSTSDPYARSTTGVTVNDNSMVNSRHKPQQQQFQIQQPQINQQQQQQLQVNYQLEQSRLRRRSEGDAPKKQQQQQQQNATTKTTAATTTTTTATSADVICSNVTANTDISHGNALQPRRVSLGDSSESCNNKTNTSSELQIKCRNTKCDQSANPADAKKYYKQCHNCTHLYCSRECRRVHWEKHRKACLHSRASNLCRQVLATCKDDVDSQRHLSLLARKGFLSQGRGVVRVLFRSAEAAEGFIKHGFQCMGEASYVRWPDLMPAEMGLELYAELLKLSTEYKPDSKMLIYVAICVVSEAPGMGQAPVRWERQLVSRCAKLKLCKTILLELEQQQQALQQQPLAVVAIPEPTTEILILTFNPNLRTSSTHRDLILTNILDILSRRGVLLRKHYPEIYQRLQTYTEGQTDKFNPVTLHPRDSNTGQGFVCIIMPVHSESEIIKLPSAADGGNRVTTIDVGSPAALAQLDDDELLTRSTS